MNKTVGQMLPITQDVETKHHLSYASVLKPAGAAGLAVIQGQEVTERAMVSNGLNKLNEMVNELP